MDYHLCSLLSLSQTIALDFGMEQSHITEWDELTLINCAWYIKLNFLKIIFLLKEYQQSNVYRVPPNYSPMSSQMMHHPQPALWGYNLVSQPQQPSFFLQNQSLNSGGCETRITGRLLWSAIWGQKLLVPNFYLPQNENLGNPVLSCNSFFCFLK